MKRILQTTALLAGIAICVVVIMWFTYDSETADYALTGSQGQELKVMRVSKSVPTSVQLSNGRVVSALSFHPSEQIDVVQAGDTVSVDKDGYLQLKVKTTGQQ